MRHVEGYFHILRINFKSQYTYVVDKCAHTHTLLKTRTHTLLNTTHTLTHTHTLIKTLTHTYAHKQQLDCRFNKIQKTTDCVSTRAPTILDIGAHTHTHKSKDTHNHTHTHTHTHQGSGMPKKIPSSKQTNKHRKWPVRERAKKEGIPKNHFKVSHTNQPIVRKREDIKSHFSS